MDIGSGVAEFVAMFEVDAEPYVIGADLIPILTEFGSQIEASFICFYGFIAVNEAP